MEKVEMEKKEFVCISCPVGCPLLVWEENGEVFVEGNTCLRGKKYGVQEFTAPMRMVTSSIPVLGGDAAMVSLKTERSVPKKSIPSVLQKAHTLSVQAPVQVGQVLCENVAGTGVNLVATRNVKRIG